MDDNYGDGATECVVCEFCGFCITCGDCKLLGCGSRDFMGIKNEDNGIQCTKDKS